jgi:hypothetical protein
MQIDLLFLPLTPVEFVPPNRLGALARFCQDPMRVRGTSTSLAFMAWRPVQRTV